MAVQSEIFSTEYGVRSFISTKHIATKQHMSVWLQRRSDNIWVQLSTSNYELINNSAVLTQAPNSITYSKVEIRVADTPDELGSSQSEIAVLAGLYDEIVALNGIKNDITTVAGISGDVTTVSSNILDINSVVTNIVPNLAEILQADTNATIATTKAEEASYYATITNYAIVETLAELEVLDTTQHNNICIVKDFDRGGTFIWSATGTANGGTVFAGVSGYWHRQYDGAVNVKWFGAKGDGITDDSVAVQDALVFAFEQDRNLDFDANKDYYITSSLLLPQRSVGSGKAYTSISINGNFCKIRTTGNISVFESAYDNSGVLTSSAYTTRDTYMSFGVNLQNFNIKGNSTATLPAIAINSYHQGCKIQNINIKEYDYAVYAQNCYYTIFDSVVTSGTKQTGVARFVFNENNNLMKFTNLVAVNANIGYKFLGLVDACDFNNNSIEGVDIGMQFIGEVRSISIVNNYIEAFTDTAIQFSSTIYSALIDNNYVNNTSGGYFVDYTQGPSNKFVIGQNNSYIGITESNLIKSTNLTVGYNDITINQEPDSITDTSLLLVDNTKYGLNAVFNRSLLVNGTYRAKKVNTFIEGAYAGKYSNGHTGTNGFVFVNTSSPTLQLNTKYINSATQRIYVNLYVYGGSFAGNLQGEFISYLGGTRFFEWSGSGYALSTKLNITVDGNGFVQINGLSTTTNITHVVGEIRLV